FGTMTLSQSTLSANDGATLGGGIFNGGTLAVSQCTLSGNSAIQGGGPGAGVGIYATKAVALNNTIVAGNSGGDLAVSLAGSFTGAFNLIEDGSGANFAGLTGTIAADPKLGPLADNGGPTQTIALLPGSPAIDAGGPSATLSSNVMADA